MKKYLLALVTLASAASIAQATAIFSDSFAYDDGSLTVVSAGVWTNHSGSTPVNVASGAAVVTQSASEDVSAGLPGGPYPLTETLYASFKVNFSALPLGNGTYFFHFRDTTTSNFRGKIFASSTNAATGFYRLGIAVAANNPALIPLDLALDTEYKVVLRYELATTNATLWINPASESSTVNRADATDTTSAEYALYSVCLRQSTSSGNGMGAMTLDDLVVGTQFSDVQTIGGPPSIGGVNDQHISANASVGPLSFLVDDVETAAADLVVTGTSDNLTLVPNAPANITLGGSGTNRTVTITPAAGQQGTATIQLTVTDGNNDSSSTTFKVYVGEPTISAVANQTTATNTVLGPIAVTITDAETPNSLTVTAASDNLGLIPDGNIVVSGTGTSRSLTITPIAETAGIAVITLTVNDGAFDVQTQFKVTVFPKLGLLINETFTYADGAIAGTGGWTTHSGTAGEAQILNGMLEMTSTRTEDISLGFPAPYYIASGSGIILYESFKVNFSALPSSSGDYFAHYRDLQTTFRARLFATTGGAADGMFRIGIANGGFTIAAVARDLATNTTYLVVTRYNAGTGESAAWVNPISEEVGAAVATDPTTAVDLYYTSFRESGGIGTMTVDDLRVGTQWTDVWEATAPQSEPLKAELMDGNLVLTWTNPAFSLQTASEVAGIYTTIADATSPYTNSISGGPMFFRLKY